MTLAAIADADGTVSINTVKSAIDKSESPNGLSPVTTIISKNGKARPTKKIRLDGKSRLIKFWVTG